MKNNLLKKVLITLLVIFGLIQFIPSSKNQSEALTDRDITKLVPVSDSVLQILRTSCFDCHSNHTNYPWYTSVQPVGLWTDNHVKEGKEELNFSEFASYDAEKQLKKFKKMKEELEDSEMPLFSYTLIHRDAVLTPEQSSILIAWANESMNLIKPQAETSGQTKEGENEEKESDED